MTEQIPFPSQMLIQVQPACILCILKLSVNVIVPASDAC